jgi:hypothetical protein
MLAERIMESLVVKRLLGEELPQSLLPWRYDEIQPRA